MNSYQKSNLEKLLRTYDFVAAHPGCSIYDICDHFNSSTNTVRCWLHHLRDDGYAVSKPGARSRGGQLPASWSVTYKERPSLPPAGMKRGRKAKRAAIEQPRALPEMRRVIKPAKQIGMPSYVDLPAEFFHPSAVA